MNETNLIILIVAVTVLLIGGGVYLSSRADTESQVGVDESVSVVVESSDHGWGDIGIDNGSVEHSFMIKNDGEATLKLFNVSTSCMCTNARLVSGDVTSPEFGMHTKSGYVFEVPSQETVQLSVVFDPAFHGPNGVGAITRQIKVQTNDPSQSDLLFNLTANVVR